VGGQNRWGAVDWEIKSPAGLWLGLPGYLSIVERLAGLE
jgi:hypothetical protein